jgi:hypothetical protein
MSSQAIPQCLCEHVKRKVEGLQATNNFLSHTKIQPHSKLQAVARSTSQPLHCKAVSRLSQTQLIAKKKKSHVQSCIIIYHVINRGLKVIYTHLNGNKPAYLIMPHRRTYNGPAQTILQPPNYPGPPHSL